MKPDDWKRVRATTSCDSHDGYFPRLRQLDWRLNTHVQGADYRDAPFYPVATPVELAMDRAAKKIEKASKRAFRDSKKKTRQAS